MILTPAAGPAVTPTASEPAKASPDRSWLDALNPDQRAAATHGERDPHGRFRSAPLLVIAGAGTGKTATLAHRVAHLVLEGVDPARILLLTFSRRAAAEMTRRARALVATTLGTARDGASTGVALPWSGTFHAIGARLLRAHADSVGIDPGFGILDRGDAADLMDVLRHQLGLSARERRFPRKDTCLAIYSHRVNTGQPLERVLADSFPWCAEWADDLRTLFRAYVARKQDDGVLDYDDLLLWWHTAVTDADLARAMGERFDQVLVDEYQDTNALQARILLAMKPDGAGLTVVGDDAQSIYAFRAADVGNILAFPEHFNPPASRITLQTNYRSVQPVLDVANTLIAQSERQYPKTLTAARGTGARPRLITVADERAQANHIIDQVLRRREEGVALRHQAVLFRSSHHAAPLEIELTRRNIPFVKHGGLRFVEAAHVKDLLSVLRWAENPRHGVAAFRALQLMSGFGPANAQRCLDHMAAQGHAFSALGAFLAPPAAGDAWPALVALMERLGAAGTPWPGQVEQALGWYRPLLARRYDDAVTRAADLEMLCAIASQYTRREQFLTELALDPPQASGDLAGTPLLDEDWLVLSTVHSAKGQEWSAVYLINVADGNFPNEYATGSPEGIEEERRLLYVAVTRARDTLELIEPLRYHVTGQPRLGDGYVHGARSRFLTPPVLQCMERAGPPASSTARDARSASPTAPRVDVASRLREMW